MPQAVSLHSLTRSQSRQIAELTAGYDGRLGVVHHHFFSFSGSEGALFSRSLGRLSPIMSL